MVLDEFRLRRRDVGTADVKVHVNKYRDTFNAPPSFSLVSLNHTSMTNFIL